MFTNLVEFIRDLHPEPLISLALWLAGIAHFSNDTSVFWPGSSATSQSVSECYTPVEWDTLARHGVHVVSVIGNNGIWALEKHPMEMLYGYSVVAELRPGTRYDEVVTALGGHGELVSTPGEVRPALERAFSSGLPAVVNALTDPTVAYPRRSNLA